MNNDFSSVLYFMSDWIELDRMLVGGLIDITIRIRELIRKTRI